MHPGMMHWWRSRRAHAECGVDAGCGPDERGGYYRRRGRSYERRMEAGSAEHGDLGAGAFGVRRPLRFLAYKLELSDAQVTQLARILNDLKTERAQAEVDGRRTLAAFADAVAGEGFDEQKAAEAAPLRVRSAERLREAVVTALRQIHGLLNGEQRGRLAYLIRTGTLSF